MKIYGITGWKNTGKTGLTERLVTAFSLAGLRVSTVKHAHHVFDVDHPGKDSHRHREAGATEVLLSSRRRWALMHELREEDELPLSDLLAKLAPVDLVLVKGYKRDRHPKVEAHRAETGNRLFPPGNQYVFGVHVYILDRNGENAFSFLLNSHHRVFVEADLTVKDSSEAARTRVIEKATQLGLAALKAQIEQARG